VSRNFDGLHPLGFVLPPQTILWLPVQIAVCYTRPEKVAAGNDVGLHPSVTGL